MGDRDKWIKSILKKLPESTYEKDRVNSECVTVNYFRTEILKYTSMGTDDELCEKWMKKHIDKHEINMENDDIYICVYRNFIDPLGTDKMLQRDRNVLEIKKMVGKAILDYCLVSKGINTIVNSLNTELIKLGCVEYSNLSSQDRVRQAFGPLVETMALVSKNTSINTSEIYSDLKARVFFIEYLGANRKNFEPNDKKLYNAVERLVIDYKMKIIGVIKNSNIDYSNIE